MRSMRLRLLPATAFAFPLLILTLLLAGCGTQGYAPALGKSGQAALSAAGSAQQQANVKFTPFNALRVTVYYRGVKLPTTGVQTPAQLRQGYCLGPLVAPLTDGNPASLANAATVTPTAATVHYAPDPAGGMDVAATASENLFVLVLAHRDDPTAAVVACGDPLSGRNQYFDLYPPQTGSSGIALGTALMTPIVATRLNFIINSATFHPTTWAVHTGSCTGTSVASGPMTSDMSGVVYQALALQTWWVTLGDATGATICGQVMAA